MNRRAVYFAVGLVSASVLIFQLALTRIFSATLYYHFAFMAISLALFGSGAGGVAVYLLSRKLEKRETGWWLTWLSILFSAAIIFSLMVQLRTRLPLDMKSVLYGKLLMVYLAAALPLFFAGALIALAVTRFARDIASLYLYDLGGAAVGCLLLIPLLNAAGAVNTVLVTATMASLAAVIFAWWATGRIARIAAVVAAIAVSAVLLVNLRTDALEFRYFKSGEETNLLFAKWNSLSRVSVSGNLEARHLHMAIDSNAATFIYKDAGIREKWPTMAGDITALAYHLKRDGQVLIIGSGGGSDVINARIAGQKEITAVEINPLIARDVMSGEPFRSYAGNLFQQPDVRLFVDEGRSFIRTSPKQYDVIQASMVDTWAATAAGAFALAENNIYTVEAFQDYRKHLAPDGILSMTRWYFEPPDQMARLVTLALEMMRREGVANPAEHFVLIKGTAGPDAGPEERVPATFLMKKSPFTPEEVAALESAAARDRFRILYTPRTRPQNIFTALLMAPDPAVLWNQWPTNITPVFDNNPFFFNNLRPSKIRWIISGPEEWRVTNLGTLVLFWLILISTGLVLLFILLPLAVARGGAMSGDTSGKLSLLSYFLCLGAGFIIVEVTLIQKFVLFLGHPVYALAVVLFSLLLFSGIGSLLTNRFSDARRAIPKAGLGVVLMVLVAVGVYSPIFYWLVALPQLARNLIAIVLIAPMGLLMGMPMPLGIRVLAAEKPEIIPWAWGVNGAASVTGSILALALAILTGFNQALSLGAFLYLIAILAMNRSRGRGHNE